MSPNENSQADRKRTYQKNKLYSMTAIVLVVVLAACCSSNWFQLMLIQGDSMMPTYHHLQLTVLDKRDNCINRGDVVAFKCETLDAVLVKRVAAVPGDIVYIKNGILCVNGQNSPEFDKDVFDYAGILSAPIELGEDEYFMIGDNTSESVDSRSPDVGIIKRNCIIGKVIGSQRERE